MSKLEHTEIGGEGVGLKLGKGVVLLNKTGRSVVVDVKVSAFSTANQNRAC